MKTKLSLLVAVLVSFNAQSADDLTAVLQQGLFNEEADHDLAAAIKAYQFVVTGADAQRKLAATAVFRLGECYRKLGQTNEAIAQYQRIVDQFTEQTNLVTLSRQNLVGLGAAKVSVAQPGDVPSVGLLEAQLAAKQADAAQVSALVQKLQALNRSELRRVVPTVARDQLLNRLLEELASAEAKTAELSETFAPGHPDLKALRGKIAALNTQIDERTAGILEGLKVQAEAFRLQVEDLKRGLASRTSTQVEAHRLLIERLELEIKTAEAKLVRQKELIRQGLAGQGWPEDTEARLLDLRRQLILARDAGPTGTADDTAAADVPLQNFSPAARAQLKELLQGEIAVASQLLADQRKRVQAGSIPSEETWRFERDVLGLNRQLLAVDGLVSAEDRKRWRDMLVEEIALAEKAVQNERVKLDGGKSIASELAKLQRDVFALKRELVTFEAAPVATASTAREPEAVLTDAEEKELKQIKAIIRDSPDLINATATKGVSRLQLAAESGQVKVAEFLLANGADVSANFGGRGTSLHLAAQSGHKTMTELLLRHGAEVNNRDPGGTPLHYAIENGHLAVAEVLLANKADVEAIGNGRGVTGEMTPLHMAAFKGFTSIAELLLAKGAQVNSTDKVRQTPLHYAATYGQSRAITQLLLTNKAEVNARSEDGWTALHRAVKSSGLTKARLLLDSHAEVNARIERGDHKGWTALHFAATYGDRAMAELLLANKAEVNALTPSSQTPLILAAGNGKIEVVEALLVPGADLNVQTSDRASAVSMAVLQKDERMMSALLAHKPDLELRNKDGLTPLQQAVANRKEDVIEPLLRAGANPNVSYDRDGNTPLHWAVQNGQKPVVKLLLAHKANVNARNHAGRTSLDHTRNSPNIGRQAADQLALDDIAVLLVEAGADEQMQRRGTISISRRSRGYLAPWFVQGSNTWNHFTLLELIASVYAQNPPVAFPDFTRVTINRLGAAGSKPAEMVVDVESILKSGDCSQDVPLEWGDVVEIPERDRKLNEAWTGLGTGPISALKKCLERKVEIVVKGEPTKLTLTQNFLSGGPQSSPQSSMFWLNSTVRNANVLRASSDLARVKVRRIDPTTKQKQEVVLNLEKADPRNDLWLHDGDVIEVPEKDPNATPASATDAAAVPGGSSPQAVPARALRRVVPPPEAK